MSAKIITGFGEVATARNSMSKDSEFSDPRPVKGISSTVVQSSPGE